MVVEVYYENGIPHSYCDPHPLIVDDLDVSEEPSEADITQAFKNALVDHFDRLIEATKKPILNASDFPSEK